MNSRTLAAESVQVGLLEGIAGSLEISGSELSSILAMLEGVANRLLGNVPTAVGNGKKEPAPPLNPPTMRQLEERCEDLRGMCASLCDVANRLQRL